MGGSGVVTTVELNEGLLRCRDPPRAHEILEVRLRVREMQQWLRTRMKPELHSIRRNLAKATERGLSGIDSVAPGDFCFRDMKMVDDSCSVTAISAPKLKEDKRVIEPGEPTSRSC